ncbi:MAG: ATP-dependent DNA ligase [Alphaproteobacteria bacterium]|nr:ATP-dependent DNA ligase [Alphaproteobacteria bacterium]
MKIPLTGWLPIGALVPFILPLDTPPMEAATADTIPAEGGPWQYEPKWDGFRCLAFKEGSDLELRAKSGKPLGRYFPEVVAMLASLAAPRFVLDGELVIEQHGSFSFDALQMRLHPADSRIRKLARETPASFIVFDLLLAPNGANLMSLPLQRRRAELEALIARVGNCAHLVLSPVSRERRDAEAWLAQSGGGALDGVVAKQLEGPYAAGERAMVKVKRRRTADCVVGGFRYLASRPQVGSLLLGLYDAADRLNHVGFTATIREEDRAALTRRLEALIESPGFTGDAPGGPSRWSTERSGQWQPLRPELVVEVRFDQVTGNRFRHGTTLLRWRLDKAPRQCRFDQLGIVEPKPVSTVDGA